MRQSTLFGNTATGSGGGIFTEQGTVNMLDSTISGNSARWGGGLYVSVEATAYVSNSTISSNGADIAGGVYAEIAGKATLINSTISNNSATRIGGMYNNGGFVIVSNTLIANSTGADCDNEDGTVIATGVNLIEDGSCVVTQALTGDPLLGSPTTAALP